jgi:hypothetical protein
LLLTFSSLFRFVAELHATAFFNRSDTLITVPSTDEKSHSLIETVAGAVLNEKITITST